jgi:hypothetical protein
LGHITHESSPTRAALLAAALGATLALGGCGGIEFEGKVFDAVGLSGVGQQTADVKMAERPPLLLPPDPKALPAPNNGVAVATARADWPQNPEVAQEQAIQAKKDERFKEEAQRQPLNPYVGKPNLFTKWLPFKKPKIEVDDVPEPDPSDQPPEGEAVAQSTVPKPLTPPVPDAEIPDDSLFHPTAPDSYKTPGTL